MKEGYAMNIYGHLQHFPVLLNNKQDACLASLYEIAFYQISLLFVIHVISLLIVDSLTIISELSAYNEGACFRIYFDGTDFTTSHNSTVCQSHSEWKIIVNAKR